MKPTSHCVSSFTVIYVKHLETLTTVSSTQTCFFNSWNQSIFETDLNCFLCHTFENLSISQGILPQEGKAGSEQMKQPM